MDALRNKYQELFFIKIDIRSMLITLQEKQKIPKDELRGWLCHVINIRYIVNDIETILTLENTRQRQRFSNEEVSDWVSSAHELKELVNGERIGDLQEFVYIDFAPGLPFLMQHLNLIRLSKKVSQLLQVTPLANEIFADFRLISNFRDRSQLLETIWGSLMDPKVGISSLYGYGGIGKTTAMRKIFDQLTTSVIFEKLVWVTLSKDMSLHKLQTDIALQINLDLPMYEDMGSRAAMILGRLKKIKKFLIIFDNIRQQISLEEVGIPQPETENGCKIVLITRSLEICMYLNSDIIVKVEPLYAEEAWNLFVSKAGNVVYIPEIQTFAKKVVKQCRGLPIAIVSVGHAMRDENNVEVWRKTFEWLRLQEVRCIEEYALKLLRFSYDHLNNNMVQNCFLYCAFFPADYLFKPEEVIRYWMAENFIYEAGDIVAEIDAGFMILRKLQDANMLQMFTEGGEVFFRMHDLFRDLAIRIVKEIPGFYVKAGLGLWGQPGWAGARKISLMQNSIPMLNAVPTNCPRISALLLSDNPISHIISSFFSQMLTLEFLDLSYSLVKELPTSISELTHLRALFLHYCARLKNIPCLDKLKNLRSLCLCGTAITELPQGLEGLVSLRSLDLSETRKLEGIRVGLLSSLSCLEELRLQGSGLCKMDSPMIANYLMEMKSLKHLAILTLSVVGYGDHLDTIVYLQEQNLKIFSVNVYGSTEDYIEDVETM